MNAVMVSTAELVELDGVECRVWRAISEAGIPFLAFIHRVAVEDVHNPGQFNDDLRSRPVAVVARDAGVVHDLRQLL